MEPKNQFCELPKHYYPVIQEDDYGCGVACVANILNCSYSKALTYFTDGERKAQTEGFYMQDMCEALRNAGWDGYWVVDQDSWQLEKERTYTIVFVEPNQIYPVGHYLMRMFGFWLNSWSNFPEYPRQSGLNKELPGKATHFIFCRKST